MVEIAKKRRARVGCRPDRWDNLTKEVFKEYDRSFENTKLLLSYRDTSALVHKLKTTRTRDIGKIKESWFKHRRSLLSDAEYDVHVACDIFFKKKIAVPKAENLYAKYA